PGPEAAQAHLRRHGIGSEAAEIDAGGADAGSALLRHAAQVEADLLVAGAFGHSRAREFILGGATRSLMAAPQVAVLLSH
ncbi:MAG: universal stress protein, partial [Allosphingosinicella sp.]